MFGSFQELPSQLDLIIGKDAGMLVELCLTDWNANLTNHMDETRCLHVARTIELVVAVKIYGCTNVS